MKTIYIASDHAGFECKKEIIKYLEKNLSAYIVHDLGPSSSDRVDYPDYADLVCKKIINENSNDFGVLICGSGQGMAIRANKFKHIRAALCWDEESAKLSRAHNHANVLCVGSRLLEVDKIKEICTSFLTTQEEEGRHLGRVLKLSSPA